MKKIFLTFMANALIGISAFSQTKGLLISEILTNPNGSNSPFEYVELVATTNINFASTPYTVVFTDNGVATANGWKAGGNISYGFLINTGSVTAGQVIYVGGSSMAPLSNGGTAIKTKNTGTTAGDSFGSLNTAGVLGNGGTSCDGVAVFNVTASSVNSSTVPVDAIFFGSAIGTAFKSSGSGYQLPKNDIYNGGKLQTNSFIAANPVVDQLVKATSGTYNPSTNSFTTARTWSVTSAVSYNTTSITISGVGNIAPTVSLATPTVSGNAPATVGLSATASDADGSISKVEFFNGSTLLASVTTSPYTYSWTNVAAGTYSITAKATDNGGATTTSSVKSVTVNASGNTAPTVTLATPTVSGNAPATVGLSATATDSDGSISKVEFFNGSTLLASVTASPYTYSWINVAAGTYSVIAKATDNLGLATTSSVKTVMVNASGNTAPTVTLATPTVSGNAPATVGLSATATDSDGSISKVEFFNGSTLLASVTASPYTYSWTNVAAGTYSVIAKATDNLGLATTSSVKIVTVNNATNVAPTLSWNTTASKFVDLASGKISCVIGDATSPVSVSGLDVTVGDESLNTLTFSMTSSKTSVVPNANFTVTGTGTARKFIITPTGVGYTTITLKVTDNGGLNKSISISLAVSAANATGSVHDYYHTGFGDASAAIVVDSNYMFVVDDEVNHISLYNRKASGLPVYTLDVTSLCGLTDDLEMDIEAAFVSPTNPNRIYWFTSQGNSKKGNVKPDRDRVFATDIVGTGANATLSFVGYYKGLRSKIISWGDANGYNLSASTADGEIPKEINGYNIEGAVMAPDNSTAYICFRAPFVPVSNRTKALICPIQNFESWFNAGHVSTNPVFGSPIELNLGTRGFRDIEKNASNQYIISAGSFDATSNFALYTWNGQGTSAPVLLNVNLAGLSPEGIAQVPTSLSGTFQIELISDVGGEIIYNDAIEQKDLTTPQYQRFVSSIVNVGGAARMSSASLIPVNESANDVNLKVYPNPVVSIVSLEFEENSIAPSKYYIYSSAGVLVKEIVVNSNDNAVDLNLNGLVTGTYVIQPVGYKNSIKITKQ